MRIICNTTPFISLAAIGNLELLPKLYGTVIVPETVVKEIDTGGRVLVPDVKILPWVAIVPDVHGEYEKLLFQLGDGERQVIINGLVMKAELVLLDDLLARKVASHLGLNVKGTLGILAEAKRKGLIGSFRNLAIKLKEEGIFFSERMIAEISRSLGE